MIPNVLSIAGSTRAAAPAFRLTSRRLGSRRIRHGGDHRVDRAEYPGRAVVPDRRSDVRCRADRRIFADVRVDAVKIGMVATAEIATAIADRLRQHGARNVVLDPVMVAKSGHHLLQADAVTELRDTLVPLAQVTTPNLPEAAVLLGSQEPASLADMRQAVRALNRLGPQMGAAEGRPFAGRVSTDLLFDGTTITELAGRRIETRNTHGTGCTLSAAIAALLPRFDMVEAAASCEGVSDGCDRRQRTTVGGQRPRAGASLPRPLDGGRSAMTAILRSGLAAHRAPAQGDRRIAVQHRAGRRHAQPRAVPGLHRAGRAVPRRSTRACCDCRRAGTRCSRRCARSAPARWRQSPSSRRCMNAT